MNVMMTMVVVVRIAPTLKEALSVLVERGICYMMMEGNVQVPKQSMYSKGIIRHIPKPVVGLWHISL